MINKRLIWGSILLVLFTLTACTSKSAKNHLPEAWLTKEVKVMLPDPKLAQPMQDQQLLTVTVDGQPNSLIALIDADGKQLTIAGLSTMGIRLFKIHYQAHRVNAEQMLFIPKLPPAAQVLSDIMLSYWPKSAWQDVLPAGWKLVDQDYQRYLYDDKNQLIIDITYPEKWADTPRKPNKIVHHVFGYQLTIQSME